jgi:hypothetical protein
MIAGWDLTPGNIVTDNAAGSVRLSSTAQALTIWTGSINEAEPKLVLGKLPLNDGVVDSPYGFAVFSGEGTVSGSEASASVLITANKARLAGWNLEPTHLVDASNKLKLEPAGEYIISSSVFWVSSAGSVTASNAIFENVRIIGGAADNSITPFSFTDPSFIGGGKSNEILNAKNALLEFKISFDFPPPIKLGSVKLNGVIELSAAPPIILTFSKIAFEAVTLPALETQNTEDDIIYSPAGSNFNLLLASTRCVGSKFQPANLALLAVINTEALASLPDTVPSPLNTANPYGLSTTPSFNGNLPNTSFGSASFILPVHIVRACAVELSLTLPAALSVTILPGVKSQPAIIF